MRRYFNIKIMFQFFFLAQIFLFSGNLLLADSPKEKIYEFYQLKKNQRPIFIINDKQEGNSIDSFTRSANKAHGIKLRKMIDSIKVLSEQRVFNISFVVDKDGKVGDIISDSQNEKVNEMINNLYGIKTEGKWISGKIEGNPVNVQIPFTISLKGSIIALILKEL